ncbi:hypothetical protein RM844_00570 [Streptomyces sp. DSM 44915]|uniref:Uncharacterized protein n=1 Tax=Streptomyces chisholmiae TaxID=3075540 RepID=A0ABU2JIG1_9ACTN|nr:hypothetical protein [Streptomyces sp. DSM 44915]MDT0264776.1 hypothetical protein [Streptomyces sp. DSM 44915]
MGDVQTGPARPAWRGRLTDPAVPVLALVCGAVAAVWYAPLLTWAIIGGLAGYSLSGSV